MNDELAVLKQALENAQHQAKDHLAGWKRAAADYQNLEKEVAREKSVWAQFAAQDLLREAIPLLDQVREAARQASAFETRDEISEWMRGVKLIFESLLAFFNKHGLEIRADFVGQTFDPAVAESVGSRKEEGKSAALVLEVVRPAYFLHDQLLRPAQVIISE